MSDASFTSPFHLLAREATLGVATHWVLKRYEPRTYATVLALISTVPAVVIAFSSPLQAFSTTTTAVLACYATYVTALSLSVLVYRLSPSHPLAKFPGPLLYRVSNLCALSMAWNGTQHVVLRELHDIYGPILRVGPNKLSVCSIDGIQTILGAGGVPKGRTYEARQDPNAPQNLLVLTGKAHAARRRLWNRGMSPEALREYERFLLRRATQLFRKLEGQKETVDMAEWISFFAFDFMGDMAFGGGFEMLQDPQGDRDILRNHIKNAMRTVAIISQVPWGASTLRTFPVFSRDLLAMRAFGVKFATQRVKSGSQVKDLWYHLTDEAKHEKTTPPMSDVVADGMLAIIAGADTVATATLSVIYYVLSTADGKYMTALQQEVDEFFARSDADLFAAAREADTLPFLNACINEALRMQPPAPTSGTRRVVDGAPKVVNGQLIPSGTDVYVPPYAFHRDPAHFSPHTNTFWPERWLLSTPAALAALGLPAPAPSSVVHNADAFIPFSAGPANCAGRALAWQEMRVVLALLVHGFDVRLATGAERWEAELRDHFVMNRGALPVTLERRRGSASLDALLDGAA
ncbi:cytochrome P450 [Auriscalpium vulgare]|uniref:Cytochrome P450 n=1 Tax=Auriscalpium vulgare TaxID=40419 RepID=A0ACB8RRK0_9AGAM|nr:cytochrome P450 [Auriscalpium vulgare]